MALLYTRDVKWTGAEAQTKAEPHDRRRLRSGAFERSESNVVRCQTACPAGLCLQSKPNGILRQKTRQLRESKNLTTPHTDDKLRGDFANPTNMTPSQRE